MRKIKRIAPAQFLCVNNSINGRLNFNPLLQSLELPNDFVILHWNRIFRAWGVYTGSSDEYLTLYAPELTLESVGYLVEILDRKDVLPTAALLYENCQVVKSPNGHYTLKAI